MGIKQTATLVRAAFAQVWSNAETEGLFIRLGE
ncbi:hypothetical protein DK880_00119 [Candidatus Cardinium hertigii]|uniref:Uncharacterized protein n=1 Tax=Candidatus Cardinium hertigii TaxID=247481 RepID=A0A2Z3LC00_9BACT|nr:hypothetical protein DK880_00119 [Candidatus Cardinium hertigii]